MDTLLKPGDVATAPVHAVVTTEQQLFQRGQSLSDAENTLGSWLPPGPAAVADYPTVLLSGAWLSQEQNVGGQRVCQVFAQARATGQTGQSWFPSQRRQTAEQPRHQFPSAAFDFVGG